MSSERKYWFKAKESGLGWSKPLTWEGWLVYAAMFGGVLYSLIMGEGVGQKILGVWVPILICIPICWLFGEPLSRSRRTK